MIRKLLIVGLAIGILGTLVAPWALAEINAVTGGIAGDDNGTLVGGDGTGEAQVEVNRLTLGLVKQARDLVGTVLPNGSNIAQGQEIYFVVYVDNPTIGAARDILVTDLLDETQFSYVDDSLEQTVVPAGSGDAAIWAGTWNTLTDGTADDAASATDTGGPASKDRITIGRVPAQMNGVVNVDGMTLKAFRFRVTVN